MLSLTFELNLCSYDFYLYSVSMTIEQCFLIQLLTMPLFKLVPLKFSVYALNPEVCHKIIIQSLENFSIHFVVFPVIQPLTVFAVSSPFLLFSCFCCYVSLTSIAFLYSGLLRTNLQTREDHKLLLHTTAGNVTDESNLWQQAQNK